MQTRRTHCTDLFYKNLYKHLVQDFRAIYPQIDDGITSPLQDLVQYRTEKRGTYYLSPYMYFKMRYQLENIFKRYRFSRDVYTDPQLEELTNQKFLDTQVRLCQHRSLPYRSFLVLQRARTICRRILGSYNMEDHIRECKFGQRADVGNNARNAYLDVKLSTVLTGSAEHIKWFKSNYLPGDSLLQEIITGKYDVVNALSLVNVPKSYKALRSIMPNTRLGVLYTYGLGRLIQERLKMEGLDIRRLQDKHRYYARIYSKNRKCVTADLSAASDSFTSELVNRLLPREWYNALKLGRVDRFVLNDTQYYMRSFMTMGVGFTFQLQTLLFYSIIKAIMELSSTRGRISVYGDDLVYPTTLHGYVSQIFTDIGFVLNEDKTFIGQSFRESCGGDFYHGIDVRPFQPEGSSQLQTSARFVVLVYKTINGLLRRWDKTEIPGTYNYCLNVVASISGRIHQVPPSFPDTSGVRVHTPNFGQAWYEPWLTVERDGNLSYKFCFLATLPRDRIVTLVKAYYWDHLRASPPCDNDYHFLIDSYESPRELLSWNPLWKFPKTQRAKLRKRFGYFVPVVAAKLDAGRIRDQWSHVPSWT